MASGITREYLDARFDRVEALVASYRDEEVQRITAVETVVKGIKTGHTRLWVLFVTLAGSTFGLFMTKLFTKVFG